MTIKELDKLFKDDFIEDELVIIEIMRLSIRSSRFLEIVKRYKLNKRMLSECMSDLKAHYYYKRCF